jgi:alpha-L-arabinofuranosidase
MSITPNFSMMPNLTKIMCENIKQLKPTLLRYPGGTVTHSWNWKEGQIKSRASKSVHLINDIKVLTEYINADFVFVLDILNSTLEDQIEMLSSIEKLGVNINYIEFGNELYAQDELYKQIFPTGKDYAVKVNQWIPELRNKFPKAKMAALLLGRKVKESNSRMYYWNRQVVDNTIALVDAFSYHIYIGENNTLAQEKTEFIEITKDAKTNNKPLWITEYGSNQDKSNQQYYTELAALANFVESYPNVTIALNHQIVGGTKNKLTDDGSGFIEEGQLFLKRVNK